MKETDLFRIRKISFPGAENAAPRSPCDDLAAAGKDLVLEGGLFKPEGHDGGPYDLEMEVVESRLALRVADFAGKRLSELHISFNPYRRLIGDYYILCDCFVGARDNAGPSRIEAIDMGRRALHNEGAELLIERLSRHVEVDLAMARRLFTIMCILHGRGNFV